jgi:hypothetical protein
MEKHLVIVYPQDQADAQQLARSLAAALKETCGDSPLLVRPNTTALCLLVQGDFKAIAKAVDSVTDAYSHWLVVKVDTPFEAHGLSTAAHWLGRKD